MNLIAFIYKNFFWH